MTLEEQIQKLTAERDAALKALRESEELSRMRLCAVMTASVQNTESTIKERIDRSNPYWTQAYADVCAAIDREMRERVAKDAALKALEEMRKALILLASDCTASDFNEHWESYKKANLMIGK